MPLATMKGYDHSKHALLVGLLREHVTPSYLRLRSLASFLVHCLDFTWSSAIDLRAQPGLLAVNF